MQNSQNVYDSWLKFFKADLQMKNDIASLMPQSTFFGDTTVERAADNLYNGIRDLKDDLLIVAGPFLGDQEKAFIENWARDAQMKVAEAGFDANKLHKAYMDTVGNMRPEFVQQVNSRVCGHTLSLAEGCSLDGAKTFNEILHNVHVYLERNNMIHEQFPSSQSISESVTVFGEQTELTKQLEASLAPLCSIANTSRQAGDTSIMSINDRSALVMIRDVGHATTFKVEQIENGQFSINYFIPKVTNEDMVKFLPGLNSMQNGMAFGNISVDQAHVGAATMTLAYNIPTDIFMPAVMQNIPDLDPSYKTAEEIIATELDANGISLFVNGNLDYVMSEHGNEAVLRGYENQYPGFIAQHVVDQCNGDFTRLPQGIMDSISRGEVFGFDNYQPEIGDSADIEFLEETLEFEN